MHFLLSMALPLILMYLIYKRRRNAVKTQTPPGPPGLPLIGNLHQFAGESNPHMYLWKLSNKYGPIMQMKLGSVPLVVVSSAKVAKQVLQTQDLSFCSRPKLQGQQKLSYNALDMAFSPYGEYWRETRKITTVHLFSSPKTQSFRPIREEEVSHMVAKIKRMPPQPSSSSSSDHVVNLSETAMALSSTLICRVAFGRRYDDHEMGIRRFEKLSCEAQGLMATPFVSDYLPWLGWVDKLSGLMDRLNKTFQELDSFYEEIIEEHVDPKRAKKEEDDEDILDILIKLKQQDNSSSAIISSWDHIKALLMNIFVAASDTSTVSVVWMMTALMKEAKVMKKVQEEIRNLIGQKGKVDEDDLPKLPYLKAVIRETLRLYPPAPLLVPRETIQTCTLEGYQIQPKTMVYVNAWAIARDPHHWENPHDFIPERFINSNTDITGQDFGAIPFGSGRRMCPGMSMGLANVELTAANLLYSFDWEMPKGIRAQDIGTEVVAGLTMHKKYPLILVAKDYVV